MYSSCVVGWEFYGHFFIQCLEVLLDNCFHWSIFIVHICFVRFSFVTVGINVNNKTKRIIIIRPIVVLY